MLGTPVAKPSWTTVLLFRWSKARGWSVHRVRNTLFFVERNVGSAGRRERCPAEGCGVCRHSFICECEDFSSARNICKHVHAVALQLSAPRLEHPVSAEEEMSLHMGNMCREAASTENNAETLMKARQAQLNEELVRLPVRLLRTDYLRNCCNSFLKYMSVPQCTLSMQP